MNVRRFASLLVTTLVVALPFATAVIAEEASKPEAPSSSTFWLDSMSLATMLQGWGAPGSGKSVDGNPITLKGTVYPHGIGTHAASEFFIDLKGSALRFESVVGVDDECASNGSVTFEVWVDGKRTAFTDIMHGGDAPKRLSVDLKGAKTMCLYVTATGDGINFDHADWAGAKIVLKPGAIDKPTPAAVPIAAPAHISSFKSAKPAIHGPRIVGATPGRQFLFGIPATGDAPLAYSAKNLPDGLSLDGKTGIISGSLTKSGETIVELTVSNALGQATRRLKIVGGNHKLALTPPMGWNSWNVWATSVDDAKIRAAADAMVSAGLAAHGYQYVNIDDCWAGQRNADGQIVPNSKFPDMNALADYVHSRGLKIGIYSSPGPLTCTGCTGSLDHEQQDADTYAKWGFDYLKYDWCSYQAKDNSLAELQKPYRVMRKALDNCGRDIVYSMCEYGMGNVWEWGTEVGGNCWRTTGDISDNWASLSGIARSQAGHEKYAGPGHWNDPDMLVVGNLGWGPNLHPTGLTQSEQVMHITMWSLLSAPLLVGCDMAQMDQFTIDLLTNDEVLDVNQDPLGKPAHVVIDGYEQVWARPLWDGTLAVGFVNNGVYEGKISVKCSDLGIKEPQPVRNLWQRKDVGTINGTLTATVPPHGAVLYKVGKPNRTDW